MLLKKCLQEYISNQIGRSESLHNILEAASDAREKNSVNKNRIRKTLREQLSSIHAKMFMIIINDNYTVYTSKYW